MLVLSIIIAVYATAIILFFNGSDSQEDTENKLKEQYFNKE